MCLKCRRTLWTDNFDCGNHVEFKSKYLNYVYKRISKTVWWRKNVKHVTVLASYYLVIFREEGLSFYRKLTVFFFCFNMTPSVFLSNFGLRLRWKIKRSQKPFLKYNPHNEELSQKNPCIQIGRWFCGTTVWIFSPTIFAYVLGLFKFCHCCLVIRVSLLQIQYQTNNITVS